MRIFTVCLVEMFKRTLEVRNKQLPYFKTDWFSKVILKVIERLKRTLYENDKSKCAIIIRSGSAAMEAVVSISLDREDRVIYKHGKLEWKAPSKG